MFIYKKFFFGAPNWFHLIGDIRQITHVVLSSIWDCFVQIVHGSNVEHETVKGFVEGLLRVNGLV